MLDANLLLWLLDSDVDQPAIMVARSTATARIPQGASDGMIGGDVGAAAKEVER